VLAASGCVDRPGGEPDAVPDAVPDAAPTSVAPSSSIAWEGVLRAGAAEVIEPPVDPQPGARLVHLRDVDDVVVIFSDRPTRREGELRPDEFVALWHTGAFGTDPPNAAVLIDGQALAVELTGAALDTVARTLSLTTVPLDGSPWLPTGEHGSVALFVDAFAADPDSQITDSVTQSNVKVIGEAPAMAMGSLYQTIAGAMQKGATGPPDSAYSTPAELAAPGGTEVGAGATTTTAPMDPPWWATGPTPTQAGVLALNPQNWGMS
jgi:hypothetical protein